MAQPKCLPKWKTKILSVTGEEGDIKIKCAVAAKNKEEINEWIKALENHTLCIYSIKSTDSAKGRYILFRQRLYCHHNTRSTKLYDQSAKNRTRNTNCPSTIKVTLRAIKKRYRGKNPNLAPDIFFPCIVEYVPYHNHAVNRADILRYKYVANEVKDKLIELFKTGHSPASALENIKLCIYLNFPDDFEIKLADRNLCPNYGYCYNLYKTEFEQKYDPSQFGDDTKDFIIKWINDYNEDNGENFVKVSFTGSNYVICVCTRLMKRVHKIIKASSEIVFMDSTGTLDHQGSRVFILLTHSECGVLPLAVIVTSAEYCLLLSNGFKMLKDMVGKDLFAGSAEGPLLFLTDDSQIEQLSVKSVWKNSECLLCIFHVLQTVWRWLTKAKNKIKQECQYELFQQFRAVVYANTLNDCEENYKHAVANALAFPNYVKYLQSYWERKELWALSHRRSKLTRGHNTNKFSEAVMRLMKDKISERTKPSNIIHLLDFILTKYERYFQIRLLDAAHNKLRKNLFSSIVKSPPEGLMERILILPNNISLVPSEKNEELHYIVNTEIFICTCATGSTGKMCKHLHWVSFLINSEDYNKKIDTMYTKEIFYFIVTGEQAPEGWLLSVKDCESNSKFKIPPSSEATKNDSCSAQDDTICSNEEVNLTFEYALAESKRYFIVTGEQAFEGWLLSVKDCENNSKFKIPLSSEATKNDSCSDQDVTICSSEEVNLTFEDALAESKRILADITDMSYEFVKQSPLEVCESLKKMREKIKKLKTPAAFSSACANFSSASN